LKIKHLAMVIIIIAISSAFLISIAHAQPQIPATVNIYAWTDKTHYDPGQKGILYIVIRNDRTEDLILQNITITYPWFGYTGEKWIGNDTIKTDPPPVITKNGGVYTKNVEFEIPKDGRAIISDIYESASITIDVFVDKYPYKYTDKPPIYVKSTPSFASFEDMDKLVTLFTVLVVLIIVCTIIIAATIFLSARRPQLLWGKEEKAE